MTGIEIRQRAALKGQEQQEWARGAGQPTPLYRASQSTDGNW